MQIKKVADLDQKKLNLVGEGANAKVFRAYYKQPTTGQHFVYAIKMANNKNVSINSWRQLTFIDRSMPWMKFKMKAAS